MQSSIRKFRQSSIVFEKPGIFSENLKTLTSSKYLQVNISWWNFAHVSYLPMSCLQKGYAELFLFCLDLVSIHSIFTLLLITQDLNKIKKNSEHSFVGVII